MMPLRMKTAFAQIMQSPHLRRFSVNFVNDLPAGLILDAYQLKTLVLRQCFLLRVAPSLGSIQRHTQPSPVGYLKALSCDISPASSGIDDLLATSKLSGSRGLLFTKIHALNLVVYKAPEACILRQAECLQKLSMITGPPLLSDAPFVSPLVNDFNHNSSATLTELTITHIFFIQRPRTSLVHDPYLGVCDGFLGNLRELQVLEVVMHFQGRYNLLPESYGPRWVKLARALMVTDAFPKLRSVSVNIRLDLGPSTAQDEQMLRDAEGMERCLRMFVYAAQLARLHGLEIGGRKIDFKFDVSIVRNNVP
ncbi:hypothetical protein NMY22_g19423 [Coprinellus aureogranulatus]|nr:hypothetical protein NMY22_g19423 [Coprinellus aureogranulatus]